MELTQTAQSIAQTVATLAALDPEARRAPLTTFYRELQAAGLPEPVAAAIQHQVAQAADGLGLATHVAVAGGDTQPTGDTVIKEK